VTLFTENTFTAARRFLENNDLPLTYIDQVAQFIEKNTSGVNLGGSDDYVDPLTGEIILLNVALAFL
jgi:phospholipase A-2-activating protein